MLVLLDIVEYTLCQSHDILITNLKVDYIIQNRAVLMYSFDINIESNVVILGNQFQLLEVQGFFKLLFHVMLGM